MTEPNDVLTKVSGDVSHELYQYCRDISLAAALSAKVRAPELIPEVVRASILTQLMSRLTLDLLAWPLTEATRDAMAGVVLRTVQAAVDASLVNRESQS